MPMIDSSSERERLLEQREHGTVLFPFAVYEWDGSCPFRVGLHWHTETELIYLEEGNYTLSVDMETIKICAPAFVCIGGSSIHGIDRVVHGHEWAVVFDPQMLSFQHYDEVQSQIVLPFLEGQLCLPRVIAVDEPCFCAVQAVYRRICTAGLKKCIPSRLLVKAGLLELLALLYEHGMLVSGTGTGSVPGETQTERIRCMLSYIQQHYCERITIENMAELLSMSREYFCRFFKKNIGCTFTSYINELRIEACAKQIAETSGKIIDIALNNGFDNVGYFMHRFKESKHMTPLEYRRLAQRKQN